MDDNLLNVIPPMNDDTVLMPHNHVNMTIHRGKNMTNTTGTTDETASITSQVFAWGWFAFVVFCFFVKPSIPDPSYRRALIERERQEHRAQARKDPVRRKGVIGKSLITKVNRKGSHVIRCFSSNDVTAHIPPLLQTVIECDKDGNLTLGDVEPDGKLSEGESISCSSDDEDSAACVICLEPFRVGDTVSWSQGNNECLHVFHHECILQWLENPKHDDCPSCRYTILHFDDDTSECGCSHEEEDNLEVSSAPIAFVIMDGLISRARRASYSLIGSSIEARTSFDNNDTPPPFHLRRVVSEGRGAVHATRVVHRASARFSGAYSQIVVLDNAETDVESQLSSANMPDDTLSLKRPIRIRRTLSERPYYQSTCLPIEDPATGLLSISRVALRRASSGLYSRLSSTLDSSVQSKSYCNNDLVDKDIVMGEQVAAEQPLGIDVDLEMGASSGLG